VLKTVQLHALTNNLCINFNLKYIIYAYVITYRKKKKAGSSKHLMILYIVQYVITKRSEIVSSCKRICGPEEGHYVEDVKSKVVVKKMAVMVG